MPVAEIRKRWAFSSLLATDHTPRCNARLRRSNKLMTQVLKSAVERGIAKWRRSEHRVGRSRHAGGVGRERKPTQCRGSGDGRRAAIAARSGRDLARFFQRDLVSDHGATAGGRAGLNFERLARPEYQ